MWDILISLVFIILGAIQLLLARKSWIEIKNNASSATSGFLPLAFYSGISIGVILIILGIAIPFF